MSLKHQSQTFTNSWSPADAAPQTRNSTLQWDDFLNGVSLPHYKSIIKKGGDATTPYQAQKRTIKVTPGDMSWTRKTTPTAKELTDYASGPIVFPSFYVPVAPSSSDKQSADNKAKAALANNVAAAFTALQGQVAVAEIGKTVNMVSGRATAIASILGEYVRDARKLRHRFLKQPKKALRDLNALYLEYTYGWSPLVGDISSLIKEMNTKQRPTVGVSGVGTFNSTVSSASSGTFHNSNCVYSYTQSDILTYSVRYKGEVVVNTPSLSPPRLGFRPEEFFPTAYELMPWSFVIDYFSNVGDCITALAYSKVGFHYLYGNTKLSGLRKYGYKSAPGPYTIRHSGGGSFETLHESTTRFLVAPVLPPPSLQLEVPNLKQLLNIGSLALARIL